jgi:hypothetical protein
VSRSSGLLNARWEDGRRDRRKFRQGTVARGRIADGTVIGLTDPPRVGTSFADEPARSCASAIFADEAR